MNSAITYLSAAQMHADAIRDARRNPPPAVPARQPAERSARRGPLLILLRRRPLRPALSL
jgi:hypothetical protein